MEINFGTRNVKILYTANAQWNLLKEPKKYKIGKAATQQTKWLRSGILDTGSHIILFSGKKNGIPELGTAIIVDCKNLLCQTQDVCLESSIINF